MPDSIQLARSFSLPVPPDHAFEVVTDAEQIADVVPGAVLTSWDGESFAATVRLRVGVVPLVGHGAGWIRARDAAARRAVVEVARRDGTVAGTVTITVDRDGRHSRVTVHADLTAPRSAGRLGRSVVTDLGHRMFAHASAALAAKLGDGPAPTSVPAGPAAEDDERWILPRVVVPAVTGAATMTAGVTLAVVRRVLGRR